MSLPASRSAARAVWALASRLSGSAGLMATPCMETAISLTPSIARGLKPLPVDFNKGFSFSSSAVESDYFDSIIYPAPVARVGEPAPEWKAGAVVDGEITQVSSADYKGKWVCLFFYPKDFTFVCPTEIIAFSDRSKEFEELGCQVIAASTDTEECHLAWIRTPRNRGGLGYMQIPILADVTKEISARYGVLIEKAGIALRGLFLVDPQGNIRQITINDLPIGRSVDETLRLLKALQYVEKHGEVCPANWTPGQKTMIADPDKSMDYFSTLENTPEAEEFSKKPMAINSRSEYEKLVSSSKPVVMDFYAPWCGKCRQIGPYVDELVDKYPGVTFAKFDITNPALEAFAGELGVKALPDFRLFKGGNQVGEPILGYKKKMLDEAVAKL